MIVDAILVGLIFYFTFPLLTGYCAVQYGRSFKVWFAIGCVLPIISFFILMIIISWDEKTTPQHKLTRREQVESDQLVDKLIKQTKSTVQKTNPVVKPVRNGFHDKETP